MSQGAKVANAGASIQLIAVRHGQTPGNALRRYVGSRDDEPLSDQGRAAALEFARRYEQQGFGFGKVARAYVTGLKRTHQTAAVLFPNAEQVVVDGIHEMDFGSFSGRSADEMAGDADYRAWVEGMCEGTCPGGESKTQFTERVCAAMEAFLRQVAAREERTVHLVAHGGTFMAFLSRFAQEARSYYEWGVGNCEGYRMDVQIDGEGLLVHTVERIPG